MYVYYQLQTHTSFMTNIITPHPIHERVRTCKMLFFDHLLAFSTYLIA